MTDVVETPADTSGIEAPAAPATEVAPATEAPAPEAAPELSDHDRHEADLADMFAPDSPSDPIRDDKGRFAPKSDEPKKASDDAPPPAPSGTEDGEALAADVEKPAEEATPAEPETPTFAKMMTKDDGNDVEVVLDPSDDDLRNVIQKGRAHDKIVQRREATAQTAAYAEFARLVRQEGYDLRYDEATQRLQITPPAAAAPAPTSAPAPEQPTSIPTNVRLAQLEAKATTGDGLSAEDVIELSRLTREEATRQMDERFQEYRKQEEAERAKATAQRQQATFNERIGAVIGGYTSQLDPEFKATVEGLAWNQVSGAVNSGRYQTIEQVEHHLKLLLDRLAPQRTPAPASDPAPPTANGNGHAPASATTPAAPASVPPVVGAGVSGGHAPPELSDEDLFDPKNPNAHRFFGRMDFG